MASRDAASACSAAAFRLRHLHLELSVAFGPAGAGHLQGCARLELTCLQEGARELVLDSHPSVEVESAALAPAPAPAPAPQPPLGGSHGEGRDAAAPRRPLRFQSRPFASYGSALHLTLPEPLTAGDTVVVEVAYRAGAGPGVCWLTPEQTAGKQKPYMYTQGQAVLNRSFFPCFDTPAVKCPYSAVIKVPEGFTALMSAITREKQKDNTFFFKMPHPIPSYLVALVVGDIVSAEVGPRSHVWAEPCLIEAAKKEYDGVIEEFLATGEKLFGPYVWERYDVLFMPPSFPFGGMENPCITFVTPCLLAGDRSLADVIIHEISHSWFGNLVTNAHWGEFWLNEGFTMYAQRRISTALYGTAYTCLEAATGRALLRQHMDNTGENHPLNKLRVTIEPGVDPEDTYNETPYEKGYCFVSYLAHLVGDQSKFDGFLQEGLWGEDVQETSAVREEMSTANRERGTWTQQPEDQTAHLKGGVCETEQEASIQMSSVPSGVTDDEKKDDREDGDKRDQDPPIQGMREIVIEEVGGARGTEEPAVLWAIEDMNDEWEEYERSGTRGVKEETDGWERKAVTVGTQTLESRVRERTGLIPRKGNEEITWAVTVRPLKWPENSPQFQQRWKREQENRNMPLWARHPCCGTPCPGREKVTLPFP